MITALLLFAVLPRLTSQIGPPYVPEEEPFLLPAADSAAVRQIYGIGVVANPASKASVSVDSGILRAEFFLASDSTEGYTANVGLTLPLSPDGRALRLAFFGAPLLKQVQFEYRLSERITDVLEWNIESGLYSPEMIAGEFEHAGSLASTMALGASTDWKTAALEYGDFNPPIWFNGPSPGFITLDSILTGVTALRVEPRTLYSDSGYKNGMVCKKCVNPTMKHIVLELRRVHIDLNCFDCGTTRIVLGLPKTPVGVSRRIAFRPAEIFWHGGVLQITNPARWTSVTVLGLDGRRLRTLAPSASQRLDLPPGSYRVLLRERDGSQAIRNLIQLH